MNRVTDKKIVLITQKTRLEQLIFRYNTPGQAEFYITHHGGDFSEYQQEHENYQNALKTVVSFLEGYARLQILDKDYLSNYLFGDNDIVIALGRDGLVVNVMKYLTSQRLIGVNPDPIRYDGVLLPFSPDDLSKILPELQKRPVKSVTLASAILNDGQKLYAVNDLFIGQKTHASARYEIHLDGRREMQSSSGVIVSTGLGSTGWLKGILAGASGIDNYYGISRKLTIPDDFNASSGYLYFTVREPFPSKATGTDIVFGKIRNNMRIISQMPENGVIFSDGMEHDYLEFNSGASVKIQVADKTGNLVI